MNNWKVLAPVAVIALAASLFAITHKQKSDNRLISERSRDIGQDLISRTNSSRLTSSPLGFTPQLSALLGSPTRVAAVLIGDDPAPLGDGTACSRLILTNESARGIQLRLGQTADPEKFRILGYWPIDNPPRLR